MWDDENDADLLRAMEESRRMYEEVEVPLRLSQQCRKPPSPVAISDDDSLPGPIQGDDDDDTDGIFLQALNESRRMYEEIEKPNRLGQRHPRAPSPAVISDDDSLPGPSTAQDPFKRPLTPVDDGSDAQPEALYDGPEAEGFSFKAGQVWVYPTSDNFPIRTYQRDIVETSIFHNTLVSLPTGLGKTFIAAVVMYNYYMWYPNGKIIFMAPTKPLVAQQIENCINIMGIPESHTAEMTGALSSKVRAGIWKEKRVFFLTPQCVQNDLSSNICPANAVKCVVIDEAHRALGDHAYSQVIRLLNSYEARFRVLALSATPGSDLEAVQKVVSNLMISRIELRTEDSPDIMKYTHQRNLELMVVDVGPTINRIRVKFTAIAAEYAKPLQQRKLIFGNVASMAKFTVLREWENFRREKANTFDPTQINRINTDFAILHSLLHGLDLLQTYGLRLLLKHIKGVLEKGDSTANRLMVNGDLKELMDEIDGVLNPIEIDEDETEGEKKKRCIYGHPKLDRLQEVIVSHFEIFEKKNEATRAIVFCEYREGVIEICEMLKNFQPLIKPVAFMGQSAGKSSKGISQKQQLEIMEKFKIGVYNTLISTSVGEEGLDIGEVDLIICFDAKNSPIRQVQRCGRTGRKRQGRIIMLVTRGKEEQKYNQGLFKKKNVRAVLVNRDNLANHLLEESPRMLPPGVQPKYTERKVVPAAAKKPKSNQQDLRKMFAKKRVTAGSSSAGTSKPSTSGRTSLGKSSYLSENDFEELQLTWNTLDCCKFDRIPERTEFWAKEPENVENYTQSSNKIDLGTYIEFMRYPQRTHVVENSTDSGLLSHLLIWADDRRENDQAMLCGGFSSQVTSTQLWPAKAKRGGRQPVPNPKVTNPPKKRGRPRKDGSIRSHFQPKDDADVQNIEPELQPSKPKSKAQFIEDDEDSTPTSPPLKLRRVKTPSPTVVPPSTKPASPIFDASTSIAPIADVIVLHSEDEEDEDDCLNISSSSGYAYLSTQGTRQELYRELSKALKSQLDEEEDECIVCDTLFLCESLNKLVLQRSVKETGKSWKDIRKSLDEALTIAPMITQEMLSKHKIEDDSPKIVSLMPRHEFAADDDMFGGLLCGGMGDLSPPRSSSPPIRKFTPIQNMFKSTLNVDKNDDIKMEIEADIKMEIETDIKIEKKEDSFAQHHFADESFDFLGLSKIDDVFGSQKLEDEDGQSLQKPKLLLDSKEEKKYVIHEKSTPVKAMKSKISDSELASPGTSRESTFMHEKDFSSGHCTPTKGSAAVTEQVSPILGSQVVKKPRTARLCKQSVSSQNLVQNNMSSGFSKESNPNNVLSKPGHKSPPPAEEVTSSSQLSTPHEETNPFEINFDIFDDSLFPLSGEDNGNKSKVDDALKEAIRKKAIEAKAKKCETSFTQEMNQLCETATGGLTQIMHMFDSKQMSTEFKIERADSSSSPQLARKSTSPITYSDDELNAAKICDDNGALAASEEDLFADCDDSIFCRVDSTVSPPPKPPSLPDEDTIGEAVMLDEGIPNSGVRDNCTEEPQANYKEDDSEDDVIQDSQDNRSTSPIFKPSQVVKRPSKLSLKKKMIDAPKPSESDTAEIVEISVKRSSDNTLENNISPSKELEQPDANLQVDFSMFGDEFNNSWLYSQEDKKDVAESKDTDKVSNCDSLNNVVEGSKNNLKNNSAELGMSAGGRARDPSEDNNPGGVKEIDIEDSRKSLKDKKVAHIDSARDRDSSPETELELAFAMLDEQRRQQKMTLGGASSSTPKVNKTYSKLKKQQSTVQHKNSGVTRTGTVSKFFPPSTQQNPKEENRFGFRQMYSKDKGGEEPSRAKNSVFNLSDFCDDSLLNTLDDGTPSIKKDVFGAGRSSDTNLECNGNVAKQVNSVVTNEEPLFKKKLSLGRKKSSSSLGNEALKNAPAVSAVSSNTKSTSDVILLSSDDESFVQNKKGKKSSLNLTSSSEEGLNQKAATDKKRKLDSSTSSESLVEYGGCRAPSAKRAKTGINIGSDNSHTLDLSAFCDDSLLEAIMNGENEENRGTATQTKKRRPEHTLSSEEDIFVKKNVARTSTNLPVHTLSSDDDVVVQKDERKSKKKKKKKHTRKGHGFIVNEADESDDGLRSSSDGESTSLDELDSSFINDSQPDASQSVVDIHAKYLQAVRSPAVARGRFKIPSKIPNMDMDVYSQFPDQSELDQTYANDSFCVDNEPTQYEPEMSLLEIAEARLKAERREKRKLKKALKNGGDVGKRKVTNNHSESADSEEELRGKRKRLKRIRVLEDTLSSDEERIVENSRRETTVQEKKSMIPASTFETCHISETQKRKEENKDLDDLAQLLDDDDIDFSAIPDIPEDAAETIEPQNSSSSSKFVRKTPFMLNGGSTTVNPSSSSSTWKMGDNTSSLQSLQTSSKQPVNSNAAATRSIISNGASHVGQNPNPWTNTSSSTKTVNSGPRARILIIASSRQIASSPDVLRVLRVNYQITIVPHSVPDADFILSWRLGVTRVFASDLKDRKRLEEVAKKLKLSYVKPHLIIEKDRMKSLADFQKKGKKGSKVAPPVPSVPNSSGQSPWNAASSCANAALLRQSGIQLLFSRDFDETAGFLAKLARKENNEGHGIPERAQNVSDEVETRLQFFASLPAINYGFALKLLAKFATLSEFFARCSSVRDIATTLGLDVNAARKIHNLLCEVHVNP